MNVRLLASAALFMATTVAASADDIDLFGYHVTFEDDFDSLSVSDWGPGTTWIAHTPWNGDFGDAKFANPREGFPFTTKDGILSIEMRRGPDNKWRSGLLAGVDRKGDGFSQQYGYFEMRAKFPAGEGVWPAFWLIGVERLKGKPKASAEIDVVEHYGRAPGEYSSSVHVWPSDKSVKRMSETEKIAVEPGSLSADYHRYGVSIDENRIRFYLDRREVWAVDTPEVHKQPMFMLVDLGLGAGWPTENAPDPAVMQVDYVRAYAKN